MSKKFLARVAATILTTGLATTGVVAGSLGPANAAGGHRHHKPPVTQPVDPGDDGGTATVSRLSDTGWG